MTMQPDYISSVGHWPNQPKRIQHLTHNCPSIQSHTKEASQIWFLITKETLQWYTIDSEKPPRDQATLWDKPLPTMALHPQPIIHLPQTTNLPTLCALLTEPPDNFQPIFLKHVLLNQKISLTPTLKHRQQYCLECADFKMPPLHPTASKTV